MEATVLYTVKFSGLVSMPTYKWLLLAVSPRDTEDLPGSQAHESKSPCSAESKAGSAK